MDFILISQRFLLIKAPGSGRGNNVHLGAGSVLWMAALERSLV